MNDAMHALSEWLARCERIHPAGIALGLERVAVVRQRLSLNFACPVVTVGGTNGKGSTCAFIEQAALHAGHRVGVYASPHLLRFEERCRIAGHPVTAQLLLPHFERVERARAATPLTYFEFTTLAILSLLAGSALDLVVLEVGLGGRLDAVNVIDADCAVITCIGLDHMDLLGPDRESIGREKAAIMRPGRPAIVADPNPPRSIEAHALRINADLRMLGRDFEFRAHPPSWDWCGRGSNLPGLPMPSLAGEHQFLNAAAALAALEAIAGRLPVSREALANGLSSVTLPGRFQVITGEPTFILDVAHNPHGAAALARHLAKHVRPHQVVHAIFGAMADKDIAGILDVLDPIVDRWYFTDLTLPRAATAQALQQAWADMPNRHAASACQCSGVAQAIDAALVAARTHDVVVVLGSFFTVGPALQQLGAAPSRHANAALHQVSLSGDAKTFACSGTQSILEGMERLGRRGIPSGCRNGGCGVCKIQVLQGEFTSRVMSRAHVSEDEQARGVVLACRTRPTSDLVVKVLGGMRQSVQGRSLDESALHAP